MRENPITVNPAATVEEAAQIMLERHIGGLPVVADGHLVGIVTASDILRAFLDVMGASHGGSSRIDFVLEGEEHGFVEVTRLIAREGGEVLGVGTYREKLGDNPICYLRLVGGTPDHIAEALRSRGFNVLGVHKIAA
jgi:acetoin utilization protein AcuB